MKKLLLALLLVLFASNVEAASRYWVGGGSSTNWNAAGPTNWSATSGGSNNASAPGLGDDVIFDGNSGSGTSNISANTAVLSSIDMSAYTGTLTQANNTTVNVAGNVTFGSSMIYAASSSTQAWSFTATNDYTFITAGHTLGNITLSHGSVRMVLGDALTLRSDATFTLSTGLLVNSAGYSVTVGVFNASSNSAKTIIMGAGTWTTIGGNNGTPWNISPTNTTLNATGSTLNIGGISGNGIRSFNPGGASFTYNDVNINSSAVGPMAIPIVSSLVAAGIVTFIGPLSVTYNTVSITAGSIVSDTTAGGLSFSVSAGSNSGIGLVQSSGMVTLSKATLQQVHASGGATFAATDSYDLGGNSGITITPPSGGGASGGYIIGGN